jgi:hypothetical protein
VEFTGCDQAVRAAIKRLGSRFMRARGGRAWLVPQPDADDLMALLEYRGYRIEMLL